MISYIYYALIGATAGTLAGLLGIGGGVIIVPSLARVFNHLAFPKDVIMHMASATSLATMIITSTTSAYSHHRRKAVQWSLFWLFMPGIILGAMVGTRLAGFLSTNTLTFIFGVFLLLVAARMFLLIPSKHERVLPGVVGLGISSFCIGLVSGMLGVGGSVLTVPFLIFHNIPMRQASGTSAALGMPIAISGALGALYTGWNYPDLPALSTGFIYWPAVIVIALFGILFVQVGAALSLKLPVKALKRIFAVLIVMTAIGMLY